MKRALVDLLERAGATFAQAFLASITLHTATGLSAVKLAGLAGAYAVAKYMLVKANAFLAKPDPTTALIDNAVKQAVLSAMAQQSGSKSP